MEKRDTFPFGTEPWGFIDEADTRVSAAGERTVQVVDRETDVMDSGTTLGDELADGRIGAVGLEELHERVASGETGDAGTVSVVELDFGEAEQVSVKGENLVERAHGDPYVGNARCTAGIVGHVSALVRKGAGAEN